MVLSLGYHLLKNLLFHGFRYWFSFHQILWWIVSGTYLKLWRSRSGDLRYYNKSAHVLDIWFKHKLDLVLEPSGPSNFITTHHSFQHPNYVLKDNITLYYVTTTEAVFIETDPELDATHSDNGAFLRVAQFLNAKRVIVLPISSFSYLADSIGDIKGKLIFVSNTTRCGSTLLSQVFEETGRVISFSEPDALNAISLYEGKLPQDILDQLVINSLRVLCKPVSRSIDYYLLKTTAPTIDSVPMFQRLFPESKQVFMYRDGLKVTQSLYRTAYQMPMLEITFLATKCSKKLTTMCFEKMGLSPEMFQVQCDEGFIFCAYTWAVIIDKYNQYRKQNLDIVAIKYEDLVKYPLPATKKIFEYCDVPTEWAETAVKALQKDSQRKSPLSMKNLHQLDTAELSPKRKEKTDLICDQFNLPRMPEVCNLDGTITNASELSNGYRNGHA